MLVPAFAVLARATAASTYALTPSFAGDTGIRTSSTVTTSGERAATFTAASAAAGVRPPTWMPPIWTRRARRAGSFGFGFGFGFAFGGGGGGVGVVTVVPVVDVVSVVVVSSSLCRLTAREPARTDAARNPANARLKTTTAAPTLRTREV